jgi:hypothetical protein
MVAEKQESVTSALHILGDFAFASFFCLFIDPYKARSYNLRCSGSPLDYSRSAGMGIGKIEAKGGRSSPNKSALIEWMQEMARKARDGAPKAG